MTESARIPQFALDRDLNAAVLLTMLGEIKKTVAEQERPTLADALMAALARALARNSHFFRSWDSGQFKLHQSVDIGIAVAVPDGLVVPVIHNADSLTIGHLASRRRLLQERANAKRLVGADMGQAVFTVSNLGPLGVHRFRPLINPPESGILGIGALQESAGAPIVTITLVCDHRVVNGADGAALLADIANTLGSLEELGRLV